MKRIRERGKEGFDDTEDEEEPVEEEEATGEDDQAGEDGQTGEGRVNFAWIQDLESNDVFLVELLFEGLVWSRLGVAGIILSSLMRIILSGSNRKMPTLLSLRRASSQTGRLDKYWKPSSSSTAIQPNRTVEQKKRNILITPPFGVPLVTKFT